MALLKALLKRVTIYSAQISVTKERNPDFVFGRHGTSRSSFEVAEKDVYVRSLHGRAFLKP